MTNHPTNHPELIVSVDQVALLRASRRGHEPDPIHFALQAELAGAAGIRAHLSVNRAYLAEQDVELLNRMVKSRFYLQMPPSQDAVHLIGSLRPSHAVFAAERREQHFTDSGLDASLLFGELQGLLRNIDQRHTRVFLFVEPDLDQIKAAAKLQVAGILINGRDLASTSAAAGRSQSPKLDRLRESVRLSVKFGLETHLANGIDAAGFPFIKELAGLRAIHLGHPLVARALQVGVVEAVRFYLNLLRL